MPTVNSQNVAAIINELIANAGNTVSLTGCPSGLLNALSFLNSSGTGPCDNFLTFKNSLGNNTTAGFFLDYAGFVTGIENLMKFQIDTSFYIPTGTGYSSGKFKRSFEGSYDLGSDFMVNLYVNGNISCFLPQTITTETRTGGSFQANPNSSEGPCQPSHLFGACGVIAGLGTSNTKQITWPSNTTQNERAFASSGKMTLYNAGLTGIVSFEISLFSPIDCMSPPPPWVCKTPIYHTNCSLPAVFYIYNFQFDQVQLNYTNYDVVLQVIPGFSIVNLQITPNEVDNLLAKIFYDINNQVNAFLQYNVYPVIYNGPPCPP
jgi:hypothetical protein